MKVHFTSRVEKINKELYRDEKKSREQAGKYLSDQLKKEVSSRFGGGDLLKGSGAIQKLRYITRVGFSKPAYHAHLVEYGTDERFIENYQGKKDNRQSSGEMTPEPFFEDLLEREAEEVGRIMEEVFIKEFA